MRRERARESAAGITGYATDAAAPAWPRRRSPVSSSWPTSWRARRAIVPVPERGDRPASRSHRTARGLGRRPTPLGRSTSTTRLGPRARRRGRPRGALGRGRVRRRRGDGPLPRASGGPRTAPPCSRPGSTTPPCSGGGSPIPPIRTRRPPRSRTRPPARPTPTSPRGSSASTAPATEVALGSRRPPLPRRGGVGRARPAARAAPPRSAAHRGARRRRRAQVRPRRSGPTATTPGSSEPRARRPASRTAAWSCARTATGAGGSSWAALRSPRTTSTSGRSPTSAHDQVVFTANPIDDATGTSVWRWTDAGLEQLTADDGVHTAVVGGDTIVVRRVVPRRPRARRCPSSADRRSTATVATPARHAERHDPPRRRAPAGHRPAAAARCRTRRAPPGAPRPLRRTARAAGGAGALGLPHLAVVRRSGLRRRGDRRPGHARTGISLGAGHPRRPRRPGPRGPDRRPARPGRRGPAARPVARGHPRAGASVATSPPSPSCAVPT